MCKMEIKFDNIYNEYLRWEQVFTDGRMPAQCGRGQRLILTNVTYEQQGQYICIASNSINGKVREVKSTPVSLEVVGAPRVCKFILIILFPHVFCTTSFNPNNFNIQNKIIHNPICYLTFYMKFNIVGFHLDYLHLFIFIFFNR